MNKKGEEMFYPRFSYPKGSLQESRDGVLMNLLKVNKNIFSYWFGLHEVVVILEPEEIQKVLSVASPSRDSIEREVSYAFCME